MRIHKQVVIKDNLKLMRPQEINEATYGKLHLKKQLTILSTSTALALRTRETILYAFDRKRIIEVARVKRDLRRDGGSTPEKIEGKSLL